MPKKRRVINRWAVVILSIILLGILSLFKIPHYLREQSLKRIGYTDAEIQVLRKAHVLSEVLQESIYSKSLLQAATKDDFQKKYFQLYIVRDQVTPEDISLYERLKKERGYTDEELISLFKAVKNYALTPLLIFEKVDVATYLEDNANHPENTAEHFVLSGDYLKEYENVTTVADPSQCDSFVSKKYSVGKYVPEKLVEIPRQYAISGLKLRSQILNNYTEMCDRLAAEVKGEGIYAVAAYISYNDQEKTYNDYGLDADKFTLRPGFQDAQLGLSVRLVSSINATVSAFSKTASYKWLQDHAAAFGFIERYPQGKEEITGLTADPAYWRYVGKDLAETLKQTKQCFEEYFYEKLASKAE